MPEYATGPTDSQRVYVWFDTEYTSLDIDRAALLQMAMLMTDDRLNRMHAPDEDLNLFIRPDPTVPCSPWVEEHLADLLVHCRSDRAVEIQEADRLVAEWMDRHLGPPSPEVSKRPVLAGNSLQHDWMLARKHLPSLMERVHYRLMDVSSWKTPWNWSSGQPKVDKADRGWVERHFPGVFAASGAAHDAHYDIHASISEWAYYLNHCPVFRGGEA